MAAPAESNFQIRVSLMDSELLIWRRMQLSGETTLEELHRVIQVVMDWENYHMHRFVASDRVYGVDEDFMPDPQSERSVTLREVIPQPQDRLLYEYDFGNGWEHEILVEELLAPEEGVRYPVCVEGEYAAPPEDCGGIPGYYMMLEAIEDEENPDHEEMLEWIGRDFDPVTVDLDGINRRLEPLRYNVGEFDRDSGLQPYCSATDSVPECSERNSIAGATAMPEVTRP